MADVLQYVVDAGLCGIIFVAPYFFGGRHDLGRLLLVSMIAVTAVAWFARQAMLPAARWPRTAAHFLLLMAAALVAFQVVPLPQNWIATLSPRTAQLLPAWNGEANNSATLGTWHTLSLTPHETTKSLAMLLSYGLLFVVVAGRIQDKADAERMLRWVALSAAVMATFGLVHYATTDGRFFWFYWHPHRLATDTLSGPFINRNHFADFLVLGIGPLLAWLFHTARHYISSSSTSKAVLKPREVLELWAVGAAASLAVLTVLISASRGGCLALLLAVGVLVMIYLSRGLADGRFIYGLVGFIVVVVGLLSIHGYDQVARRLDDFTEGSMDDIDQGGIRRKLWAANASAFEAGWLTGAGAGSHCDVCPVYLPQSFTKEYTHAENGYLQIATENGIGGIALLAAAIVLCGAWCIGGMFRATDPDIVRLLGAAAAGLAASIVHSVVDFVWYIPACMSITIILAACALRLSQMARPAEVQAVCLRILPRGRWIERAAAAVLIGGWAVHTYFGPGIAAVHWDRYLRASVSSNKLSRQQLSALVDSQSASQVAEQTPLNDTMLSELEQVVRWDPQFARAHLRLAARCMAKFDLLQQESPNAMGFGEIRDTLAATSFVSQAKRHEWLERAFGPNLDWLRRAATEARLAASLCPLQGEAYIQLAQLSFLSDADSNAPAEKALVDQGLRVRPHDASVLFEVGRQEFIAGDVESATARWKQCFDDTGPHQLKIVFLLAGRISAATFIETFQPDWRTLRGIWARYRDANQPNDADALLAYAAKCAEHETDDDHGIPLAYIWFWQAQFYSDANRPDDSLKCLERAYQHGPRLYFVRRSLAQALQSVGRSAEAEPHYRWCLARRPGDKSLSDALAEISKQRLMNRVQSAEPFQQSRAFTTGAAPRQRQAFPAVNTSYVAPK